MVYRRRIGQFLALLGAFLVALFIFSDISKLPEYALLGWGAVLLVAGIVLVVGNPKPPPEPNPRFKMVKKLREKTKKGSKPQMVGRRSEEREKQEEKREKAQKEERRS